MHPKLLSQALSLEKLGRSSPSPDPCGLLSLAIPRIPQEDRKTKQIRTNCQTLLGSKANMRPHKAALTPPEHGAEPWAIHCSLGGLTPWSDRRGSHYDAARPH